MEKIIILVPYFGKFPPMFEYWYKTALANSTIDFLLFTDQKIESKENIKTVNMSFDDMRKLIQSKFDFKINLEQPYKLCDYRLAFGYIFEEYVRGYDFWGYSDVDMVLGDLRYMLKDKIDNFDKYNYHGHISLYRTNSDANNLWKLIEKDPRAFNFKEVFSTPDSMYFDEYWGGYSKSLLLGVRVYHNMDICRDPITKECKFYDNIHGVKQQFVILWKNNKLYSVTKDGKETEIIYAHFFRRKFITIKNDKLTQFKIIPGKIIDCDSVNATDFDAREVDFYKQKYIIRKSLNSFKRYGFIKSIRRQKSIRKMNKYHDELRIKFNVKKS